MPGRRTLKITMTTTQAIGSASASNDLPDSTERRRRLRRWRVAPGVVGVTCWSDVMREPSRQSSPLPSAAVTDASAELRRQYSAIRSFVTSAPVRNPTRRPRAITPTRSQIVASCS